MAEGVLARLGRWCFRHWWWALAAWVIIVTAGVLATGPVFEALTDNDSPEGVESIEAYDVLGAESTQAGSIIGLVDGVDLAAPGVCPAVNRAAAELAAERDAVRSVASPCVAGAPPEMTRTYRSGDGQAFLVVATLAKIDDQAAENDAIDMVSARLHRLGDELRAAGQPQARVRVGGNPVLGREANKMVREDLLQAELYSLPISLVVLVLIFGGLVAAGIPVMSAAVAVASAMVALLGFSKVTTLDQNTVTVVSLLGLGLSIDYGLLLVGRYREELAAGFAPDIAVGRAWATAGRTIMFSALTVAAALSGLLFFGLTGLSALGAAGVSIAAVAMLVSLTFTPALLGLLRRWVKPSRRARRNPGRDLTESGLFARVAVLVQRRPVVVTLVTSALLLLAGAPLLSTTTRLPGLEQIPREVESRQVADELGSRFGRVQTPAVTVVARTDPATLGRWAERWAADAAVARVEPAEPAGSNLSTVQLDVRSDDPQSAAAQELVGRVRADRLPGARSWVTGDAAVLVDLKARLVKGLPWAVGVTVLAMVVLLFAMTGSVVVPIKAVLANAVSLGATFGVMNAVFERGFLTGPLDMLKVGGLDPYLMVVIFAFAFGLSMDYEVFLLGRIKEYVERGDDTNTAVRRGLQHTGRIITSAAMLMVIVFGCFAAARIGGVEQVGLGLSVAVLIDATIVRCLLVPATMTLMGQWNWWAPAPLKRLHARVGLREHPLPAATTSQPSLAGHEQVSAREA